MQASHSPRQAPPEYTALYQYGQNGDNYNRVTFQAQTTTADDAIRDIVEYLKRSKLWDNTLVVIGSDNGGKRHYGDNAPFRGFKNTSWEGGVKVPGFITGGYLKKERRGKVMTYPMHFVDWYPTLLSAAGLDINYERSRRLYEIEENYDLKENVFKEDVKWDDTEDIELDGINMWEYIQGEDEDDQYFEREREILLDVKEVWCPFSSCGAIRIGRYKYIRGNNIASLIPNYDDGDKWFRGYVKNETKSEEHCTAKQHIFKKVHSVDKFIINSVECIDTETGCLFDLDLDPCEYYDLSSLYPDINKKLKDRLDFFQEQSAPPLMGENNANELFGKEVIQPERVCHNPQFWCPFKRYKDVDDIFENKLFQRRKISGNIDNDKEQQPTQIAMDWTLRQWIVYLVLPICVFIVVIGSIVYCCYCRKRRRKIIDYVSGNTNDDESDIIDDISEVQPLKRDREVINVNIRNNTRYGSTTIK